MQTPRLFVSYSTVNSALVSDTLDRIDRPFISVDRIEIKTGDEILSRIREEIGRSDVFVFFASGDSLASLWVTAEIRLAEYRAEMGQFGRVITILLEPDLEASHLPGWLQRYRMTRRTTPRTIGREIQAALDDVIREYQTPIFVGRTQELHDVGRILVPLDGTPSPRCFWLHGLPGVGRRTLLRHAVRDLLSIRSLVEVPINAGDTTREVSLTVAAELGDIKSAEDLRLYTDYVAHLSDEKVAENTLDLCRSGMNPSEALLLHDEGGLLTEGGHIRSEFLSLFIQLLNARDTYFFVVSRRRPFIAPDQEVAPHLFQVPIKSVSPLQETAVMQLVSRIAELRHMSLSRGQVASLAGVVRGYPPSVTAAFQLAESYGLDFVLRDAERLSSLRTGTMIRYLNTVRVSHRQRTLMSILSAVSPLPFPVIEQVAGGQAAKNQAGRSSTFEQDFGLLLDTALVNVDAHGYYELAAPVSDLVGRHFRLPDVSELMPALRDALKRYLEDLDAEAWSAGGIIFLTKSFTKAHLLAGGSINDPGVWAFASDVFTSARSLYYEENFERAEEVAREGLTLRPAEPVGHMTLVKALIKQGKFADAGEAIEKYKAVTKSPANINWLLGFLERHRNNPQRSAEYYQEAIRLGYEGVSIRRELAMVYKDLGKYELVNENLDRASQRDRQNRYVIDLRVQVACELRRESEAREWLAQLELVDSHPYYLHRASRVESSFGQYERARRLAEEAAELKRHPPFAFLSQLVFTSIRTHDLDRAEDRLRHLEQRFPRRNPDVRTGLKCELLLARGRFSEALSVWQELQAKSRPVHLVLRQRALVGLRDRLGAWSPERRGIEAELAELEQKLRLVGVDPGSALDLPEADPLDIDTIDDAASEE